MFPRIISVNGVDKRRFYQPKNQLLRKCVLQCSGISINFYRTFTKEIHCFATFGNGQKHFDVRVEKFATRTMELS